MTMTLHEPDIKAHTYDDSRPSTRGRDLTTKTDVYGRAGVPVYLLFDMKEQRLSVYSDPSPRHGYQNRTSVEFGKPVHVPESFGFELDTTAFKR